MITVTRRAAIAALCAVVTSPTFAQTASKSKPEGGEYAALEQPAVFDLAAKSGSLKETVQKGQELFWRRKMSEKERQFQLDNISVAFLRNETGSLVKITFSGNVSSLGYEPSDEAKLTLSVRTKAGAALYSWSFGITVKCGDSSKPLAPLAHDVPTDIAANVFANAGAVEIAELTEPNSPGVRVQRCAEGL
jgi:hypothetical protein